MINPTGAFRAVITGLETVAPRPTVCRRATGTGGRSHGVVFVDEFATDDTCTRPAVARYHSGHD